jgi:peroxiredoxin
MTRPAPELVGTTDGRTIELTDLDGERVRLADYRGRAVWLNFWASWCPPCQEETPVLRSIDERFRDDGLAVIGVSVQETTPEDVRRYVDTYELRYTIGFDATSAIFDTYRVFGLPTQFFIDRDGVVRDIIFGPLTEDQVEGIIAPLLEEDAASAPPAAGGESPGASVTARPSATP